MKGHTPGPWATLEVMESRPFGERQRAIYITADKGWAVGERTVAIVGDWRDRPNADADARLIAAAPTGLAVAERMYLWMLTNLRPSTPHYTLRIRSQAQLSELRDYIAEATGRKPQDVQDDFESRALKATGSEVPA